MRDFIRSTLCYLEKDGNYLMLFRNKKENDPCEGKWVGIGGKFEEGEDENDCLLREVWEETGLTLTSYRARGVIRFISDRLPQEDMYLFTADGWEGELSECNEGELRWIPIQDVPKLNLWEGDMYFIKPLTEGQDNIYMTCIYEGDKLTAVEF